MLIAAIAVSSLISSNAFSQEDEVNIAEIKDIAMKMVDINVRPITSSTVRRTMNGSFYETYIERSNGETFSVSQVYKKDDLIRSFFLPDETKEISEVLSFIKSDYVMIENSEARTLLSALRMVYNIDSVFPMYVNRFRDRWVLIVDRHEDNDVFVGFTAKINGEGLITKLVFSDEISISEAQRIDLDKLNDNQNDN